ncbi:dual specificity protein kinase Ttk, partial [Biomphalaria glabrata]
SNAKQDSLGEAEKILSYAHRKMHQFAIVHVAYAELELKKGNKDKALHILQKAISSNAQPLAVIFKAQERFAEGRTKLLSSDERDEFCSSYSPHSSQDSSDEWNNSIFQKSFNPNKENSQNMFDQENIAPFKLHQELTAAKEPLESHSERNPMSLTSFNTLPETPKPNSTLNDNIPGSHQKKLGHFHSTPNLMPTLYTSFKQSERKGFLSIGSTNLGPPRRIKVNPNVKKWSEESPNNNSESPTGSVFSNTSGKSNDPSPERTDTNSNAETPEMLSTESKSYTRVLSHFSSHPILPLPKVFTNQESELPMHNPAGKANVINFPNWGLNSGESEPMIPEMDKKSESRLGNKDGELPSLKRSLTSSEDDPSSVSTTCSASSVDTIKEKLYVRPENLELNSCTEKNKKESPLKSSTYKIQDSSAPSNHVTAAPNNLVTAAPVISSTNTIASASSKHPKVKYVNGVAYTVLRQIGRGGSAKVYKIFDPVSNDIRALKIVDLLYASDMIREGYLNEIRFLKKLQHCEPVIKLYDSEYNEKEKKLYAVLEYGETDLDKMIGQTKDKKLDAFTIGYFWKQIVEAVHAMHQEGVIHSDLKPANFLLISGKVKLIDFGIANAIQNDCTSIIKEEKVGTPSYMSPESLMEINGIAQPKFKIGRKSDVWSLGCILYQMVYGHTPFQYLTMREKLAAIVNTNYSISFPDTGSPALTDILKKCLTRDVSLRPTTDEILNHPYLTSDHQVGCSNQTNTDPVDPTLRLLKEKLSGFSPSRKELSLKKILEFVDGKNS